MLNLVDTIIVSVQNISTVMARHNNNEDSALMSRGLIPHWILDQYRNKNASGNFDAAVLFIDLSGFTSLSERLTEYGNEGSEILSQLINELFEPQIEQVYQHGGFISNFAGDAFIGLFPSDSNPGRAVENATKCAKFIQDFVKHNGTKEIKSEEFTIKSRLGLGFGNVDWGIIQSGASNSFFFKGDGLDDAFSAEVHATVGDIIASPLFISLISPSLDNQLIDDGFASISTDGAREIFDQPLPNIHQDMMQPFVPHEILNMVNLGEFREVVTIFISFDGESSGWPKLIQQLIDLGHRYGGFYRQTAFDDKGAVAILLFGAPRSFGNDIKRAADFLLALQKLPMETPWLAGMTIGTVFTGFQGSTLRSEYVALGLYVNLAARIMGKMFKGRDDKPAWSEVWMSDLAAKNLQESGYLFEEAGKFELKGIKDRMQVMRLIGASGPPEKLPLILEHDAYEGRRTELAWLDQQVSTILQSQEPNLIVVYGEPGAGKTRLLQEFKRNHSAIQMFICEMDDVLKESLYPFHMLLKHYFEQNGKLTHQENIERFTTRCERLISDLQNSTLIDELKAHKDIFVKMLGLDESNDEQTQLDIASVISSIVTLLQAESTRHPVVLMIEDTQWLDQDSQSVIMHLVPTLADYPLVLITTSRSGADAYTPDFGEETEKILKPLELRPMRDADGRKFIENHFKGEVTNRLANYVKDRTNLNPFLVQQLISYLKAKSGVYQDDFQLWDIEDITMSEIPADSNRILVARFDNLPDQMRDLVATATVLGTRFNIELLHSMVEEVDHIEALLVELEQMRFFRRDANTVMFDHALLRDAIYEMRMNKERRQIHLKAAQAIEKLYRDGLESYYSILAYHYGKAEDHENELKYALRAGRYKYFIASTDNVRNLERAVELLQQEESLNVIALAEILHELGTALILRGDFKSAKIWLEMSVKLYKELGDLPGQAKIWNELGTISAQSGQMQEALDYFFKAKEVFEKIETDDGKKGLVGSIIFIGNIYFHIGEYHLAIEYFEEAFPLAVKFASKRGLSSLNNNMGLTYRMLWKLAQAYNHFNNAIKVSDDIGDIRSKGMQLSNLADLARAIGDLEKMELYLNQADEIYRSLEDPAGTANATTAKAIIAVLRKDPETAVAHIKQAAAALRGAENLQEETLILSISGHAYMLAGNYSEAIKSIESSVENWRKFHDPFLENEHIAYLAKAHSLNGDLATAHKLIKDVWEFVQENGADGADDPVHVYLLCYQLLLDIDSDQAEIALRSGIEILTDRGGLLEENFRKMYFNNIPSHREIRRIWDEKNTE